LEKIQALNIPQGQLQELGQFLARNERAAWAEALKLYRRIKKEKGIDLFEGMTNQELKNFLEKDLESYDVIFHHLMPNPQLKLFLIKNFGGSSK
jgi:hypothetical protein